MMTIFLAFMLPVAFVLGFWFGVRSFRKMIEAEAQKFPRLDEALGQGLTGEPGKGNKSR